MNTTGAVKLRPGERVKGYIPAVEVTGPNLVQQPAKLIPWQKAAYHGHGPIAQQTPNVEVWSNDEVHVKVPQDMVDRMHSGLPPLIRRTPDQRYQSLVRRLMEMGRAFSAGRGYPVWPQSLQLVLDAAGIPRGDTDLHKQVFALAKHFIVKSENAQKRKDAKKHVLDWHGHFN